MISFNAPFSQGVQTSFMLTAEITNEICAHCEFVSNRNNNYSSLFEDDFSTAQEHRFQRQNFTQKHAEQSAKPLRTSKYKTCFLSLIWSCPVTARGIQPTSSDTFATSSKAEGSRLRDHFCVVLVLTSFCRVSVVHRVCHE